MWEVVSPVVAVVVARVVMVLFVLFGPSLRVIRASTSHPEPTLDIILVKISPAVIQIILLIDASVVGCRFAAGDNTA